MPIDASNFRDRIACGPVIPRIVALLFVAFLVGAARGSARADDPIVFGRDVLPILSENCFACHGPDAAHRKADLRLDTREGALAALSLDKPAASELLVRVLATDEETVMPPPSSHKKRLAASQVATLRRWIEAGAPWGRHWSFERPVKVAPPRTTPDPIDAFVRARLTQEKLTPSRPASPHTLARRLSFDLIGLPPTPAEVDEFVQDAKQQPQAAIERRIDRLLASPHFGERMAYWWLDAARYADTDGYQGDATRNNWPWRDWVVDAFHRNMPFDQFTIEQFAGDLLPDATPEQRLATCFHRNHMTNGEGGRDPEESRIDYVIDRVNTTGAVWLGLTLGCCQCHSHKYDPVTQRDFYSLTAFFNSIDEDGKAGGAARPYLKFQSPRAARAVDEAKQLVDLRKPRETAARRAAEGPFAAWLTSRAAELDDRFQAWRPLKASELESAEGTLLAQEPDATVQASGPNPRQDDYRLTAQTDLKRVTGLKLEVLPHASHTGGGLSRGATGEFILTDVKVQVRRSGSSQARDVRVAAAVADASADQKGAKGYGDVKGVLDDDPRNGWTTQGHDPKQPHVALFALAEPLTLEADERLVFELRQRSTQGDANVGRFRVSATDQAGATVRRLETPPMEAFAQWLREPSHREKAVAAGAAASRALVDSLEPKLKEKLFDQFLADHAPYQAEKSALERASRQLNEVQNAAKPQNVMVLTERAEPRTTHVLLRGVWDKKGERVERDVPAAIAPWPNAGAADAPRTRLELARWIVSRDNPLTARVVVNHFWQMLFGVGLVKTAEDFGLQGERPTHPELLDWLAVDFMEHGWDVKRLLKQIASSQTYQQDSAATPEQLAVDPENRWLARGARYRLPSWMLRDAALRSSGLWNEAIGGPPVRPYQPDGVWEEMFMGRFQYEPSEGAAQHRRTLYAFWRRAIAPTFLFDSAQRRVCEVRSSRTNTPLQALTLMNDANYLAAARALAERAMKAAADADARLTELMRRVVSRGPTNDELSVLRRELDRASSHYARHPDDARRFLHATNYQHGDPNIDQLGDDPQADATLAAYTLAANLVLNLDEALNRE